MNSKAKDIYHGDELDSEWGKYVASLHENNHIINKKYRDKKRIIQRERETMINLQKHVRGLSRARFELEDAAVDSFDDSSSDTGTVNIINTPIHYDDNNNNNNNKSDSDNNSSDSDFIQPTPSVTSLINKPLNYNNYNNNYKKDDPYNIKSDSNISISAYDSNDSDINDSHCIDSNDSNDSNDSAFSDSSDTCSPKSLKSSEKSSSIESIEQMEYDQELAKLKKELNQFKKRNFSRLKRTKSQEEVLLSVLNIDEKHIDKKQLQKCTKKAITKYNTITLREKRRVEREKKKELKQKLQSKTINISKPIYKPYKPLYKRMSKKQRIKKHKVRRLADPYDLEWNGLDPDDYMWYDEMAEGECYDDKELSLYNRRMQFLVIMSIENHYCSINDLTYQQNELLLLYQQSIKF